MKPIIISADDFAQSAAIDAAIIALIQQGRLSATSCMTLSPRWTDAAKLITDNIRSKADIGLHLDFTQYKQPLRHSLPILIARALSHSLPVNQIYAAINHQLDHFESALGTPPDYVDGHQHVHQLPQIREALLEVLSKRYGNRLPWLRIARPPQQSGYKALIIKLLGANELEVQGYKAGFRCSQNLLGVYAFEGDKADYEKQLDAWFAMAKSLDGVSVLMCHPALAAAQNHDDHHDPIHDARINEYQVFSQYLLPKRMSKYDLGLARGQVLAK